MPLSSCTSLQTARTYTASGIAVYPSEFTTRVVRVVIDNKKKWVIECLSDGKKALSKKNDMNLRLVKVGYLYDKRTCSSMNLSAHTA